MTERKRHSTTAQTRVVDSKRAFAVGDHVEWRADGFLAVRGIVDGFSPDRKFVVVKTEIGHVLTWPVSDARLHYAQTSDYEPDLEMTSEDAFDQTLPDGRRTK